MTACWRNETLLSAILYHLFVVTWCKLLPPYLTQGYENSWRHLPNDTQSFDVAELPTMRRCSWLSVWPSYIYMCTIQTIWHSESKECLGKVCVLCHVNPFCNLVVYSFPRGRSSLLASDLGSELMKNRNTLLFYTLVLLVLSKYTIWKSYHDLI